MELYTTVMQRNNPQWKPVIHCLTQCFRLNHLPVISTKACDWLTQGRISAVRIDSSRSGLVLERLLNTRRVAVTMKTKQV